MSALNKAMIIGRLGKDPQIHVQPDGGLIANMQVATDESYKDKQGNKIQKTEWHRVVCFDPIAKIAQDYASKGRLVIVTGPMRLRKWTDKNNIDRYSTEIVAREFRLLDNTKKDAEPQTPNIEDTINPDGIPF